MIASSVRRWTFQSPKSPDKIKAGKDWLNPHPKHILRRNMTSFTKERQQQQKRREKLVIFLSAFTSPAGQLKFAWSVYQRLSLFRNDKDEKSSREFFW